ncbi:MAG: hypothetical protein DSZ28_07820 [Thiothrix sp.]|nr:MAG: hypothetical protein DSZ28_07820 [Thiothrix sp.]
MSNAAFSSIINDAIQVITHPVRFYRQMEKSGGFATPIIFVIVMSITTGLIVAILSFFGTGISAGITIGLMAIVMIPILALIGSFIGAAILFVIWKLLGSEESFETTYRCVAYSMAIIPFTALLGLIPYLGSIIKIAWSTFLIYVASIKVHNIRSGSAMTVFGVLGVIMLVMTLSGERATRSLSAQINGNFDSQLQKSGEQPSPKETGKVLGKLLGSNDQPKNPDKQLETEEALLPEEAGKALGEFLKGIEKATRQEQ